MENNISGNRDIKKEWQELNKRFVLGPKMEDDNKQNKIAYLGETYAVTPMAYDLELLKQYQCVITWNSKFYEQNKNILNIYLIKDFYLCHDLYDRDIVLDRYISYDEKINGICLVSNLKTYFDCNDGAIGYKRLNVMNNITGIKKHIYGGSNCGDMYGGIIGHLDPNCSYVNIHKYKYDKILKINQYLYSLVFENCYHPIWSWDYITEKIWDVFAAKTIPIYYGCYNIEQRIPKELYIDYRDFGNDVELSKYLITFPKDKYKKMIDSAFNYYNQMKPTFLKDLKELIAKLNV